MAGSPTVTAGRARRRVTMAEVDKKWAERIRSGDRRVLVSQFRHEARELRRIAAEQPSSFHAPWRDFRNFLADVGPSPGPAYRLMQPPGTGGGYRPGAVVWALRNAVNAEAPGDKRAGSAWTMLSGMVQPTGEGAAPPSDLPLTFAALPNDAPQEAGRPTSVAAAVGDLSWFSPEPAHQQAFRQGYLAWRAHVQPKYLSAATPQFLYLFTLVPAMARCKTTLTEAGLWKPLTKAATDQRDDHPAWKRFNELLPKAVVMVAGFEIYRQYSLTDDIDELCQRLQAAELRFRTGGVRDARTAA